jgi:ankyrin repeat protein
MFFVDAIFNTQAHQFNQIVEYIQNHYGDTYPKLRAMLKKFDQRTCDEDGKTLLHLFAYRDFNTLPTLFLDHGADIHQRDKKGKTPLFYTRDYASFVRRGADPNVRDHQGHSVLYYASQTFSYKACVPLIRAGATIDYDEFPPQETMHYAVLFRDRIKMKECVAADPDVVHAKVPRIYYYDLLTTITPLFVAGHNGFCDEFLWLLDHGANPQQPGLILSIMMWQFSHESPSPDVVRIVQRLVALGASVTDQDEMKETRGETVLHKCGRSYELVKLFLEAGADIHQKTEEKPHHPGRFPDLRNNFYYGAEPLHRMAMQDASLNVYQLLFEHGADPNVRTSNGATAFMTLCYWVSFFGNRATEKCDILRLFLDKGANIYVTDHDGNTVFDYLCANTNLSADNKRVIVQLLQDKERFVVLRPQNNEFVYNLLYNMGRMQR